ncbi:MAG: hypothetical protein KGL39_42590 [Patescibacteria group bacterium]|nr:hypothetical protein [Patescibacteria group bacterium]
MILYNCLMKSSTAQVTTMLEKFDDSKRAVANLMARENITVQVVDGLDTAKFSPELRILQVPNWTNLSTEQCDLLMSHEIGHALFTDRKIGKGISKGLFSYLNIIEDARIERRMKGAFPGLAPTFYKGYREFHADGPILKGTQDSLENPKTKTLVKIASMRLIDRINLHYKIGAFATVPFTADEKAILARIDRATSTQECLDIATELWNADKHQENKQDKQNPTDKLQPKPQDTDESDEQDGDDQNASDGESTDGDESDSDETDGDGDSTDGDEDDEQDADGSGSDQDEDGDEENDGGNASDENPESSDESDEGDSKDSESDNTDNTEKKDGESKGVDDAKPGSQTVADPEADTDTEDGLKSLASKGGQSIVKHLVYPVLPEKILKDRVVPAREFAERGQKALTESGCDASALDNLETNWNAKYLATAKHMALEFERKKNAKALAAVKTAKSGKLDLTKLSQYRWTEDLFKRSMTVPNGKSHGVVVMIDGSGSMASQFAAVIDQTLLFAQFAFAVNIPFEAYMFSDCLDYREDGTTVGAFTCESTGINSLTLGSTGRLIGLINTTTDRAGFKKQVRVLLAVRSQYARDVRAVAGAHAIPNSGLGGTPLFTGMMIAETLVAKMKRDRKLDKTTFIVLTDGEDTNRVWYKSNAQTDPYSYYSYNRNHAGFECLSGPFVVRDVVSKRNLTFVEQGPYGVDAPANAVLTMLLDVMKLRHDTRTIYIYLQESRRNYYGYHRSYNRTRRPGVTLNGINYLVRAGQQESFSKIDRTKIVAGLKEDAQYVLPAGIGVADLSILLPQDSVTLTEDEFAKLDTDNMSQKKIAAEFTKSMVKAVANRKFVNSVIPHLA